MSIVASLFRNSARVSARGAGLRIRMGQSAGSAPAKQDLDAKPSPMIGHRNRTHGLSALISANATKVSST